MKKQFISLLTAGVLAVMLSGCAGSSDSSKTAEGSITYETIDGITEAAAKNAAEKIRTTKYDNIKFADTFTVDIGNADALGVYEAERSTGLISHADDIFAAYFGDRFDSAKVQSRDTQTGSGTVQELSYEYEGEELHITPQNIYYTNKSQADKNLYFSNDDKLGALYEVTDSFKSQRVKLAEGEATVGELANKLNGFIEKLGNLSAGEFRPFTLASLSNENAGRNYPTTLLTYRKYFKGLPIFNFAYNPQNSESLDLSYLLIESDFTSFASPDSIYSFGFSSPYKEVKKVSAAEKILTPESAVKTASRELAPYIEVTALRLNLVYVPTVQQGAKDNSKVTFSPYWLLSFDLKPLAEHYALIDAISGKVIYSKQ